MKVRIEIHLEQKDTKALDKIAAQQGRSRKNLCEYLVKNYIESLLDKQAKK